MQCRVEIQRREIINDKIRVNERIRVPQIRLIDEAGNQRGLMTPAEALALALAAGLDLVEVAPAANPPVCRIMDFSKFRYEQAKKAREARKKQHVIHVKEIKFHPNIDEHDYTFKKNHLERFLKRGDKVKITMVFRGRETQRVSTGQAVLNRLLTDLAPFGALEKDPHREGRQLIMLLNPK